MASSQAPIVDRIRIIPRPTDFLNRNVGASGEVFYSKESGSLRIYTGVIEGGVEIARADFANVDKAAIGITNDDINWIPYALESDLPGAADNHGMFAHVHDTGKAYYAHAGNWVELANQEDIPTVPSDLSDLTDNTNLLSSSDWPDITNKPNYLGDTSIAFAQGVEINEFSNDSTLTDASNTAVPTEFAVKTYVDTAVSENAGGVSNAFVTLVSEDGSFNVGSAGELTIVGGTNISTEVITDSEQLTINMDSFEIEFLSNVSSAAPTSGQVLKWDGSQWAPAADIASGGAGLDADTLDGFDSTYYLDYNNFTNTPSVLTLTSLSVGNELAASGDGAISYDNTTGEFRYTPPDLSAYSTFDGAFSSLTGTPTTISGYGITDAYSANQSLNTSDSPEFKNTTIRDTGSNDPGLTIADDITSSSTTSLSIERLGSAFGDLINASIAGDGTKFRVTASGQITAGGITYPITDGTNGQVMTTDGAGNLSFTTVTGGSGGEANQNAFSNVAVSGQTTIQADSTTDTLTLASGTGISIVTSDGTDTVTISSTVTAPSNFTDLTDVTTASISIDKIYEPAATMFRVDNVGTSAYTFAPHYSGNNPQLYIIGGHTYAFDLDAIPGHPFEIQDSTGTAYNTGLVHVSSNGTVSTGSSAQGKDSGTLYWRVPESIASPPNYRYQCQFHTGMVGAITIIDASTL